MVFKHWLVWLFITFVRQLGSDSMKACHLACHYDVCTCPDVCARYGWKWPGNVIKSKNKGCKTAHEILCSGGNQNITVLHGGVYNRKLWNVDFDTVPVSELNGFKIWKSLDDTISRCLRDSKLACFFQSQISTMFMGYSCKRGVHFRSCVV